MDKKVVIIIVVVVVVLCCCCLAALGLFFGYDPLMQAISGGA